MADAEVGKLPAWAQQATAIIGFLWLLGVTIKSVVADRRNAKDDRAQDTVKRIASVAARRGRRNKQRIQKFEGKLDTVEEASNRVIELLKEENDKLRARHDETVRLHNAEVLDLRSQIAELRSEMSKVLEDSRRRQEDYDKSRVEIHGLRNDLAAERGKNELLGAENASLQTKNDELLAKQTPPAN